MAKKRNKPVKEESLETILFNCRNSPHGRAAMTDKRDLLLTLVFLKFIGERFKQQKEKIRHEIIEVQGINDTDFIELQLSHPNQYMQDGVFFLTDETFWDKLILTDRTGEILFIDLRTWNSNIYEKKYVRLSETEIDRVRQIYLNWQTENFAEYAEPELYYAAHRDEIQKKGYSLVPSRYIEFIKILGYGKE